jgi:tetratricopeptide (TPR) repeat protein
MAMTQLGNGLYDTNQHEDALPVQEAVLSMRLRLGTSEYFILVAKGNLANSYQMLGRLDETLRMRRDVYSGRLKLLGEEHLQTLQEAYNYATSLTTLKRFEEAKLLLRKTIPVARHVLGESHEVTLRTRSIYAQALYRDEGATLNDLRESMTTFEDAERIARRVLGGTHPLAKDIERDLRNAREALAARETPGSG